LLNFCLPIAADHAGGTRRAKAQKDVGFSLDPHPGINSSHSVDELDP
jgi:hypothetical protein